MSERNLLVPQSNCRRKLVALILRSCLIPSTGSDVDAALKAKQKLLEEVSKCISCPSNGGYRKRKSKPACNVRQPKRQRLQRQQRLQPSRRRRHSLLLKRRQTLAMLLTLKLLLVQQRTELLLNSPLVLPRTAQDCLLLVQLLLLVRMEPRVEALLPRDLDPRLRLRQRPLLLLRPQKLPLNRKRKRNRLHLLRRKRVFLDPEQQRQLLGQPRRLSRNS